LAVCTLQCYCGGASIPIRKQIGQALVRVYKSNNKTSIEIQYVVLSSIRQLVQDCPSAFIPYIQDFFILPNIEPNYTRMIKRDILTYLAIDPPCIMAVLNELRTYLRQINYYTDDSDHNMNSIDDIYFVSASIRAVGRIVENARIVYDRHAELVLLSSENQQDFTRKQQILQQYRIDANRIASNCLYGSITLAKATESNSSTMVTTITTEAILVLQRILQLLNCDISDSILRLNDPNRIHDHAFHRILLLLVNTLNCVTDNKGDEEDDHSDEEDDGAGDDMRRKLEQFTCILPPVPTASAIC
jgi:AP-3 complex subunit beta